ncbi:MAG: hypothetical protein WC356_01645 [Candidatus Micrarchaeia archaeon]|jgi:hypothetical protein
MIIMGETFMKNDVAYYRESQEPKPQLTPDPEQAAFEAKWSPVIDKTCTVPGCLKRQYGASGVCFQHLLRQVGVFK